MALGVMAIHRFLYGVNFIALILMSRNLLNDPADAAAGLATFGLLAGISFAGNALAIVLTPLAHEWMRPSVWIVVCLGIGALSQTLLAVTPAYAVIVIAAVLLGLSVQGAKIAVDTIVQRDTADAYRGRAFSLYDMLYNIAFVGAAALAADCAARHRPVGAAVRGARGRLRAARARAIAPAPPRLHDSPREIPVA